MTTLKRLERLEARMRERERMRNVPACILEWVGPDGLPQPVERVQQLAGWPLVEVRTWERRDGEDDAAFAERVIAEAGRNAALVAVPNK